MMHIRHQWKMMDAQHLELGTVWTPNDKLTPITLVLYACEKCTKTKTTRLKGHWDAANFKSAVQ